MFDKRGTLLEFIKDWREDLYQKGERVFAVPYREHEGETVEWATERGNIIPHYYVKEIR